MKNKLGKLLIVDDDSLVLDALRETFIDEYDIVDASSGAEALEAMRSNTDVDAIVLDIKMAKINGLETATKIKESYPDVPIIFHTGYPGSYSEEEIERGYQPFDYIGKNERPARLVRAVKNAVTYHKLRTSQATLIELARREYGLVGKSSLMLNVYQKIEKIGPTDNKVMILGPTGTGKELVARAIHKRSLRASRPLAIFNCNHKAPDLVEAELFGHLRGSFTGAVADRVGTFEYADGGTVFLDEIGDLDITTQAKILRVLETGEFVKIGTSEVRRVDVRLICATHHDLVRLVAEKRFREDLYYRLKGVTIDLPALRERREDIPLLIDYFSERYCQKAETGLKLFEQTARDYLIEYNWPGNVRQLMDTVQSLIDLSPSYYISLQEVTNYLAGTYNAGNGDAGLADQVREFKRIVILKQLDKNNGNVSATARDLSLDPSNLRKLIRELNINQG